MLVAALLFGACTSPTEDVATSASASRYGTSLGPVQVVPPGTARAITSGAGSIWVAAEGIAGGTGDHGTAVLRIDPSTGGVIATIPTETAPPWDTGGGGLLFADDSVWVTGGGGIDGAALLQRIDVATNYLSASTTLGTTVHGTTGVDIAATDRGIWVASTGGIADWGKVTLVDPDTNLLEWQIDLKGTESVRRIAATDDSVVVQANSDDGFIAIDPHSLQVTGNFKLEGHRAGPRIVTHGGQVWGVTGAGETAEISPLDKTTAAPTDGGLPLNSEPDGFLISDGATLWYSAEPLDGQGADVLSSLDATTGVISVHGKTAGIATIMEGDLWTLRMDGTLMRTPLPS